MIPLIIFFASMVVFVFTTVRSQSETGRRRARYQATGVGAVLIAGVAGLVLEGGGLRYAWLALAVVALVRLIWLQRAGRGRGGAGASTPDVA